MRIAIVSADRTDDNGAPWNLGDAFLTDVLIEELRARGHEGVAIDFGSPRTMGSRSRLHASPRDLLRFIKNADGVIVGGGTLLQDDNRQSSFGGLPRLCAVASLSAAIARKPLAFLGVGCDPVDRPVPRFLLRAAVARRQVAVRDVESQLRVETQLRHDAQLAADLCLLPAGERLLGTCIRKTSEPKHHVFALNKLATADLVRPLLTASHDMTEARPVLLAMSQGSGGSDLPLEVLASVDGTGVFAGYPLAWTNAASVIAGSSAVFASRMHALYLALLLGVPMVAIGTSAKVTAFAREFDVPQVEKLTNETLRLARRADDEAVSIARQRVTGALGLTLQAFTRSRREKSRQQFALTGPQTVAAPNLVEDPS